MKGRGVGREGRGQDGTWGLRVTMRERETKRENTWRGKQSKIVLTDE